MTRARDVATSSPAPPIAERFAGVGPASAQASCLLAAAGELAVVGAGRLRTAATAAAAVVVLATFLIVWRNARSLVVALAVAVMVSFAASAPWVINDGITKGSAGDACRGALQMCQAHVVAHGASVADTAAAVDEGAL